MGSVYITAIENVDLVIKLSGKMLLQMPSLGGCTHVLDGLSMQKANLCCN